MGSHRGAKLQGTGYPEWGPHEACERETRKEHCRENLIDMPEAGNGPPRRLCGLKVGSHAWVRMQVKSGGHSENNEKGSDRITGSVASRECEILES